jgi:hypothetical protein
MRRRQRPTRRWNRPDSSCTRGAVKPAQSQEPARRPRRARELSLRFPHRRREQGHRERRQRLRRRGAPNDYRVDATPTVSRGSWTPWTVTMRQVMGSTVTHFLRPVTNRRVAARPAGGSSIEMPAAVPDTCRRWDTSGMDRWGAPLYGDPCRECGFRWATGLEAMTSLMRGLPDSIDELVTGATGAERLPVWLHRAHD